MKTTNGMEAAPRERQWEVDGLRYAGLEWGPENGIPVLALHGWLDHAGSFRELAPLLTGCHVIALDLSGQGMSGHRAAHATYNIWDDLPQIAGLIDQLGWQDCVLLGHSRGAIISSLFAAALPEKVRAFVALDALAPEQVETDAFVSNLRSFVEQTGKQKSRPPRIFATRAEFVERRNAYGNSRRTSGALADRALEEVPEGFRLRNDPRMMATSAVKLSSGHVEAVLKSIRCPVLNIWASEGVRKRRPGFDEQIRRAGELIAVYEVAELPGDHHFHLDPEVAAQIAHAMLDFLDRHWVR